MTPPPHPLPSEETKTLPCAHMDFAAQVNVSRLTKHKADGIVTGYMAEITIKCAECGVPFQFLGLAPGLDTQGARVSIDGLEANIAISPDGVKPNPYHRMVYNVSQFS